MTIRIGKLRLDVVSDGTFLLDGGAMFGVVPKTIWSRHRTPDEKNRIVIGLNSLLVRSDEGFVALIDTGMGTKWSPKMREIYGLVQAPGLVPSLAALGVAPEDVTHVLFSHLHLDHAGCNTAPDGNGGLRVTFPNARHIAQRGEWLDATSDHPAMRESYTPEDLHPVHDAGLFDFIDGDVEILPGIRSIVTGGHTQHHQVLVIGEGAGAAIFLADLIPTTSHLKPHYHMAYDLFPIVIGEQRIRIEEEILRNDWLCIFEHDATTPLARLEKNERGALVARPVSG